MGLGASLGLVCGMHEVPIHQDLHARQSGPGVGSNCVIQRNDNVHDDPKWSRAHLVGLVETKVNLEEGHSAPGVLMFLAPHGLSRKITRGGGD